MRTRKQHMNPKDQGGDHRIFIHLLRKPIRRTIEKPKQEKNIHDTEKDEDRSRTHWRKANTLYLVDPLAKHGWKWPKTQSGQNARRTQKELGQIMVDLLRI